MIFSGFILFITWIATAIFSFLPDGTGWPSSVHSYASTLGSYLGAWNVIFPVDTVLEIISLLVTLMLAYFAVQAFFWMYKLFRGRADIGGLGGSTESPIGGGNMNLHGDNKIRPSFRNKGSMM